MDWRATTPLTEEWATTPSMGGAGNDTLDGGVGLDSLNGGEGNDTYVVDNVGDVAGESTNDAVGGVDTRPYWKLS